MKPRSWGGGVYDLTKRKAETDSKERRWHALGYRDNAEIWRLIGKKYNLLYDSRLVDKMVLFAPPLFYMAGHDQRENNRIKREE